MKRRQFITLLGGAAVAWPLAARAQQHVHVIGVLASQLLPPVQRFERKLREYGYVEGQNVRFVPRFAEGRDDLYPAMAAELVALPVDLIVTWGTPAALAAKQATSSIPVVMGAIGDPVSVGIVSNLARPSGNITGFAAQNVDLEGKRLELLKDLLPHLSRVAMLANAANPMVDASLRTLRPAAEQLGINIDIFDARSSTEIETALQHLNDARPDGVLVAPDLLLLTQRTEIAAALEKYRLPAV
jgi:putative ABC transport system substrate-binding protein